jgi:hypothetical protein
VKACEAHLRAECRELVESEADGGDVSVIAGAIREPESWAEPVMIVQVVKRVLQVPRVNVQVELKEMPL